MSFSSRSHYKELRVGLGALMKGAGFAVATDGRLGWTRPSQGGYLSVWFQCDKQGWDALWGSRFTAEFVLGAEPASSIPAGRFERLGYLLEGFEDLDQLRLRNNEVIVRLPGSVENRMVVTTMPDGASFVSEGYAVDPDKAVYGRDVWLNYYSQQDARLWAKYFEDKLLHFVNLFESGTRSEVGHARARYNALMTEVQGTANIERKRELLARFAEEDACPHFASAARQWLDYVDERLAEGAKEAAGGS